MSADRFLPTGKLPRELFSALLAEFSAAAGVLRGPGWGQDVAILDAGDPASCLVVTSDPITFATDALGEYAVAVNANDVATSGGEPRWFVVTLLLPAGQTDPALVEDLFSQLRAAAERWGIAVVGGHTEVTGTVTTPVVCGTMLGTVPRDRWLTSAGARPGDEILLVGSVPVEGTALLAREAGSRLRALRFGEAELAAAAALLHSPGLCVLPAARLLRELGPDLHALHDPTEGGLAAGLWELAGASGLRLEVDLELAPRLELGERFCAALGLDWRGLIASGCLLAAAAPGSAQRLSGAASHAGLPLTRLGTARPGTGDVPGVPRFERDEFARLL